MQSSQMVRGRKFVAVIVYVVVLFIDEMYSMKHVQCVTFMFYIILWFGDKSLKCLLKAGGRGRSGRQLQ